MFANTKAYSGLAVRDMEDARRFYGETLGLKTSEEYGLMWLHLAGGRDTLVYEQSGATPASFTILNFEVDNIDEAVDALAARGVRFERYERVAQDEKGGVPRRGSLHRLVQGPVRQCAVRAPREVEKGRPRDQTLIHE
jgi:catechol 2,3-dioxygenase-like lactoylglutathione lyase family enzyme